MSFPGGTGNDSLTHLGKQKATDMSLTRKGVKPEYMSPTEDATKYHSLRACLKIVYWKILQEREINPTGWG